MFVASSEKHPFQTLQWFQPFHRFVLFKTLKTFGFGGGSSTFREFSKRRNEGDTLCCR